MLMGVAFFVTDYGDEVLTGNYVCRTEGQTYLLRINKDHTFRQAKIGTGVSVRSEGTWRRFCEAHVAFSKGMLALARQRTKPNGDSYGELDKTLGIWPYIAVDSTTSAPIYRKTIFGHPF